MQAQVSKSARWMTKALGFSLMLWIPLLGPLGYLAGLPWLSPVIIFVVVPVVDLLLGDDRTNEEGRPAAAWRAYHYAIPRTYVLTWLACLVWTARLLAENDATMGECAGLLVAAGIASGFATCAAHELLHRPRPADQWAARVTMAMCCYGHFVVEHLHHHATAGRVSQGTVPRRGESMYSFIVRNVRFGFGNAYRIAEAMRRRRNVAWMFNRVVQQHLLSGFFCGLWVGTFGAVGLVLFAGQALFAIATVEMVQYFEHYGLTREAGESQGIRHAWNSNGWATNAITLNITRHSDHHMDAQVPYQGLRMLPQAPAMPMGYFGLAWLALLPPVWRTVVDRAALSAQVQRPEA